MLRFDRRSLIAPLTLCITPLWSFSTAAAQDEHSDSMHFGVCIPAAARAGRDVGCFIITERPVGSIGVTPVYWHVTQLASDTDADTADVRGGAVIDAFGSAWLLTIGDSAWRPRRGEQRAVIGPLPVKRGLAYSALYMEASMRPGMKSAIHRHSGPEAWYTLSGQTCLETPDGAMTGRAGGPPVIVPGGPPMELTATGTVVRRSLVLILHDSSQPPTRTETQWKPRGLCSH
jgi:quercetin dioxygenase-like cupin family protein